jgi:predicted nuclease of restriction endonuclease-like (RecB) superfamily
MTPPKRPKSKDADARSVRGSRKDAVSFPVPPPALESPAGYAEALAEIKGRIQSERLRAVMAANSAMILLYWDIGRLILDRQQRQGWGARVIDRLSADLRADFPDLTGLSPRNLLFMRSFAAAYQESEMVKQLVSQLPWGHIIRLLQGVKEPDIRHWYIKASIENGWSRNILDLQIKSSAHERAGQATHNFALTLPPTDSDMAAQIFKDPYLFDFLGTADPRREREVQQALTDHIQRFLLELGAGFAFVGRQVHLEFASRDFYLDLLFYHLKLRRYVVVELKAVPFDPAFVGTLNLYLSAVDDLLRHPDDQPSIGLLLCRSKDKLVAEYALRGFNKPIGVAEWETEIVKKLPEELKSSLPSIAEIEAELTMGNPTENP